MRRASLCLMSMFALWALDGMPATSGGELCQSGLVAQAASLSHSSAPHMPFGIDKRIRWTTSHVVGSPDPPPPYRIERSFPRLKFEQPLYLMKEPGSDYLFVIQRYGKIVHFGTTRMPTRHRFFSIRAGRPMPWPSTHFMQKTGTSMFF